MSFTLADMMTACQDQAIWSRDSIYLWENNPTVPKSKYKETCVTFNACVLQRLGVLASGKYIFHDKAGKVTGPTSGMKIIYPENKTLHQLKNDLAAGDILLDGDKTDLNLRSHIFIITGQWQGNDPYVWDNHSAQQNLMDYVYTRNRPVFAVVRLLDIATFEPRLADSGILGSPYYYSLNPFYNAGYGLPNCTCYAWGRFWEESDDGSYSNPPTLSTGNAEDWFANTADGYNRGSTPQLGAVLCLADGPYSGDGHVAIVEQINPDGSIVTSNSAYGGQFFYTETLQPPDYLPVAGYVFQGFIYNPNASGNSWIGPPLGNNNIKVWLMKRLLWKRKQELY